MSDKPKTVSLHGRPSLVDLASLGTAIDPVAGIGDFLASLPDIYGGRDLIKLARRWADCALAGKRIGIGYGAHVVKVGVQSHLLDLCDRNALHMFATHGAGAIHDIELAMAGKTSEDVAASLEAGRFGMAGETVEVWEAGLARASANEIGLGQALGEEINEGQFPYREHSILARAAAAGRPVSVLVAIGTDTIHVHPGIDAAALGAASMRDFRRFCDFVGELEDGLWINLGSAVIMPEAFLKGVAIARNAGKDLSGMTTAVLDMIRHYRPTENVVRRPPGTGLQLHGQHEFLVPLLHQAVRWYADHPEDR